MKTNKLALLAALGLAAAIPSAYSQSDSSEPGPGHPPGGPRGRPNPGAMLLSLLDKYDANHDGVLDATEMAALKKDVQEGKVQPPRNGQRPGDDSAARPHQPPSPKELIDRFDTDKDGKLDATELAALLKDMRSHRPPMGGPGGPGGPRGHGGPPPGDEGGQ